MGFKFSSFYNEHNIELSEERIEELLIQYLEENCSDNVFLDEINSFLNPACHFYQKSYTSFSDNNKMFNKIQKPYNKNSNNLNYNKIKNTIKVAA